jgi:hypothetical protein
MVRLKFPSIVSIDTIYTIDVDSSIDTIVTIDMLLSIDTIDTIDN